MENNKLQAIKQYIKKSGDTLIDAEISLSNLRLENAQNRIYYAIFYIVTSLAYTNNFITSKHSQLMGWFNKKFIHEEKIFDESLYVTYKDAFENRQNADYSIYISFSKEEVESNLNKAKDFIETVKEYINSIMKD